MRFSHKTPRAFMLSALGVLFAAALIGCGGGSSKSILPISRSYLYISGGSICSLSVDSAGRFTFYASDTANLPTGVAGQGTVPSSGAVTGTSTNGTAQISGTISSDGSAFTGSITKSSTTVFTFVAPVQAIGTPTHTSYIGTFKGTQGTDTVQITVDAYGHSTLWASVTGVIGGGLLTVGTDGSVASADSAILGQLSYSGSTLTLVITKLAGVTVNQSFILSATTRAKWTFMVFLNGANNLQTYGPLNVNQMEEVGSTADVNIVVQWKQAACTTCGNPDWVGTRRYYITKDADTSTIHSTLIQDMGTNIDMGSYTALRNFILWSQSQYPADHYALVIWDHGAGWRPTRADDKLPTYPRSVSIDDSMNTEIETWQLPQALNVSPKLDMVIFDASLMQMTEVAYEIRNSATYVVGSEESPPGEGYVYNTFLTSLTQAPNETPATFGTQIVNQTLDSYGSNTNLTQSCIDLSKMDAIATKLDAFGTSLISHVTDSSSAETYARNNAQSYAYPDNKDLYDYAALIKANTTATDLQNAATAVQSAITDSLIAERHGTINGNSHGLAIYVPAKASYLTSYANLALARVTSWPTWLQSQP